MFACYVCSPSSSYIDIRCVLACYLVTCVFTSLGYVCGRSLCACKLCVRMRCVGLLGIVDIYACVFSLLMDMCVEGYCVCACVCVGLLPCYVVPIVPTLIFPVGTYILSNFCYFRPCTYVFFDALLSRTIRTWRVTVRVHMYPLF